MWVFIKYAVVGIGLIRTVIVANALSIENMGLFAFYLLVLEYSVVLIPIGSINAINKQISNLKGTVANLSYDDDRVKKIYLTGYLIITFSLVFVAILIFIFDSYIYNLFPNIIRETKYIFISLIILSLYRSLANIHNRLWEKYNRLFLSELSYGILYLLGILIFLKDNDGYIPILYILLASTAVSIVLSRFIISIKNLKLINIDSFKSSMDIGFFLMCYITMETLFWGIDRFFIATVLDPDQLAIFHICHTFGRGILMFYAALTFLFYPLLLSQYSKESINSEKLLDSIKKMSRFSETILIYVILISIILIPFFIKIFLPEYPDVTTLQYVILIGLLLKGLAFFPSSYFIAVSWHRVLTVISFSFIGLIGAVYIIFGKIFNLNAFGYSSIATLSFLIFLYTLTYILMKKINIKNPVINIFKIYYKITFVFIITLLLLIIPNFSQSMLNIYVLVIFTSLFYLNDLLEALKETLIPILKKDKSNFLKSFNYYNSN